MRRRWATRVAAGLAVAAGLLGGLAAGYGPAAGATSAPAATSLLVRTVPVVAGARVILDGHAYLTGAQGSVTIPSSPGRHTIRILPPRRVRGTSLRFSRWLDGIALPVRRIALSPGTNIAQAGFVVSHPVTVSFADEHGRPVPAARVTSVTLANSLGQRFTFSPAHPPSTLAVNRIVRDQSGLHPLLIRYSVRSAVIDNSNVVYGGSQDFFLRPHHLAWTIKVLLFPLRIEVRDALFGFGTGTAVQVTLPNHALRVVRLGPGHAAVLTGLPRATYELIAKGRGFGLSAPTTLSKPQVAKLLLFSWVDVLAVVAFAVLFVAGLPLLGGRIVRGRGRMRLPVWHGGHHTGPQPAAPAIPAAPDAPVTPAVPAGAGQAPAGPTPADREAVTQNDAAQNDVTRETAEQDSAAREPAQQAIRPKPPDRPLAPLWPTGQGLTGQESQFRPPRESSGTGPAPALPAPVPERDPDATVILPAITDDGPPPSTPANGEAGPGSVPAPGAPAEALPAKRRQS